MKMSFNCPYFLLQLAFLECFMFFASYGRSIHITHILQIESLVHALSLGSSLPNFLSALVRRWPFAGVPLFFRFRFQIRVILSLFFSLSQSWRRDSISRPLKLFVESWRITTPSHHDLTIFYDYAYAVISLMCFWIDNKCLFKKKDRKEKILHFQMCNA